MLSPLSSTSRALKIGITSSKLSQMDLTMLARWTIRPRLMSVPGVANVAIWGQRDRELQVLVNPDDLRAHDITLDQVVKAAGDATVLGAGGFIDTPNQRLPVRQLSLDFGDPDAEVVIDTARLADLVIHVAPDPPRPSAAPANGELTA